MATTIKILIVVATKFLALAHKLPALYAINIMLPTESLCGVLHGFGNLRSPNFSKCFLTLSKKGVCALQDLCDARFTCLRTQLWIIF